MVAVMDSGGLTSILTPRHGTLVQIKDCQLLAAVVPR
jgi:hypothetical protein